MEREPAKTFRDLTVWQKAHAFVLGIYRLSAQFPSHETYGLSAQMRRAAVSVPANIPEGFKRRGRSDKARHMNIAESSLEEARYYLLLAKDLSYPDEPSLMDEAEEVAGLLAAYSRAFLTPVS